MLGEIPGTNARTIVGNPELSEALAAEEVCGREIFGLFPAVWADREFSGIGTAINACLEVLDCSNLLMVVANS